MRGMLLSLVVSVLAFSGCKKDGDHAAAAAKSAAPAEIKSTTGADGLRHIAVVANADGYTPGRIPGKPGEKLVLVFTRTVDSDCISQLKAPDGKLVDLPKDKPVEVAVTVPQTGEVGFACGMDMYHGVVVAQPSS